MQLRRGYLAGRLRTDTVSRRHAELRFEEGRWLLRDLGSSNGTSVTAATSTEIEVRTGDVIHLGGCRLRLFEGSRQPHEVTVSWSTG